ncbi:MAG TPA: hypothetical protein VIM86_09300 [Thermodesulfobacteriota bacterium]
MSGAVAAIAALVLVAATTDAAAAERGPGPARRGRLVTVDRTWWHVPAPAERRLCLRIENRDDRTAHEAAAWVELLGGPGPAMRRLGIVRVPLEPATLAPGESAGACVDAPLVVRGIFVRLRARWLAPEPSRSGAEPAPRP